MNVHQAIQEAISHIQLILKDKSGELKTNFNAKNLYILGNKNHFTNIVVNLLDNALKYCDQNPKVEIETFNEDNEFVLKVKDNGIGMTPHVQKKVFDKFYRAASGDIHNVKGHGLGLAYVKKIVENHGGKVYAKSEKGKGSSFFVELPINNK